MTGMPRADISVFRTGLFLGLQRGSNSADEAWRQSLRHAALIALLGWLPLVVLTVAYDMRVRADVEGSLLWEVGAHTRYLVAAPLLVIAESFAAPRLDAIVRLFVDGGQITPANRARFDAVLASTRALIRSKVATAAIIALSYLLTLASVATMPIDQVPGWHRTAGAVPVYSPAGWWHVLVSLPLLIALVLGWLWRLVQWTCLLWRIAQLDLRLLVSHPDRAAGLGFVAYSVRAYSLAGFALATIVAGRAARTVVLGGELPSQFAAVNFGLLVTVVVIFSAPLLVFFPTLVRAWQRGALVYGALADQVGRRFEDNWIRRNQEIGPDALAEPDFSATTDLYSIVANVYAMRLIPIEFTSIGILIVAALLPSIPVVLLALPFHQIVAGLQNLVF